MKEALLEDIKIKSVPILQKADVKKAVLFGSYARGDNTSDSDIDILVDVPRGTTIIDLVGLQQDLEAVLKRKVDIITYNSIHPLLKNSIFSKQYQIL